MSTRQVAAAGRADRETVVGADIFDEPGDGRADDRAIAGNMCYLFDEAVNQRLLARLNVFMICADRCGVERGCTFAGSSCVVGPTGYLAGPASFSDEEFITADINLSQARYHHWTALSDPLQDRRVDVYAADLGYCPPRDAD